VGKRIATNQSKTRTYRLRLGVLAETLAAFESSRVPEFAKLLTEGAGNGKPESSEERQHFSYISPDGFMIELAAVELEVVDVSVGTIDFESQGKGMEVFKYDIKRDVDRIIRGKDY